MTWLPTPSAEVAQVACPPDKQTVPSTVEPSQNSTTPSGVAPVAVALAVKTMGCAGSVGLAEEVKVIVIAVLPAPLKLT
jgi:hypothetical protein